jgi:hypothetical protein
MHGETVKFPRHIFAKYYIISFTILWLCIVIDSSLW